MPTWPKTTVIVLLCLFWATTNGHAQVHQVLTTEFYSPLILVFARPEREAQVEKAIASMPEYRRNKQHFIVTTGRGQSVINTVNDLLNGPDKLLFDKQRIYLLLVGTTDLVPVDGLDRTIFADATTVVLADSLQTLDFQPILDKFSKSYLWEIRLNVLESQDYKVSHQQKKRGFGLVLGQHAQTTYGPDSVYLPRNMMKYGLAFYGDRGTKWQWKTSVLTSLEIPNQSKIQSQIFSQVDIGAEGEQVINAEIKMHILVQAAVQVNYMLKPYRRLHPYVGAGVGVNFLVAGRAQIQDTIDISSAFSGGGGPPSLGDAGGNPRDNMRLLNHTYFTPQLSVGTYYSLGKHTQLAFHLDYHLLQGSAKVDGVKVRSGLSPLSANLGMRFVFGRSKRYCYYLKNDNMRP